MERSKIVAYITGGISIILALAYLLLVSVLDFRGEMLPAPVSQIPSTVLVENIAGNLSVNFQAVIATAKAVRTPDGY
ncbi:MULTISPECIES: hypothetical protein [Planktothrix]|jgi:hypothetical protein|uniref:Glucose-inhibited division protein A n=2 Tax=Planktothrix TaxID=54304 RepID=A0A4P5ZMM3_PLAAG|nr:MULTISPECIES: hypothetical protein [Planktothrix]CAD5953867.1 hypothetical protein NO108_03094 [Planktothrix rubescens]MCF3571613.1 hypothetical protein [Planktothrix agardhii 1805]MCF3575013.1 hypothetical protein [Planktothrix agardhii 1812]MCF3583119.1 hypothetical protein [Planktothrix agardhii 1811]MCF3602171.1 hypothetical protein [Planktothrix agardhii 1804]